MPCPAPSEIRVVYEPERMGTHCSCVPSCSLSDSSLHRCLQRVWFPRSKTCLYFARLGKSAATFQIQALHQQPPQSTKLLKWENKNSVVECLPLRIAFLASFTFSDWFESALSKVLWLPFLCTFLCRLEERFLCDLSARALIAPCCVSLLAAYIMAALYTCCAECSDAFV